MFTKSSPGFKQAMPDQQVLSLNAFALPIGKVAPVIDPRSIAPMRMRPRSVFLNIRQLYRKSASIPSRLYAFCVTMSPLAAFD